MRRSPYIEGDLVGTLLDGDEGFVGVNQLQPGPKEVADCRNGRFVTTEEGEEAQPRLGVAKLPWTNRVSGAYTTPQPFSTVWGAGEFRDSDDLRWVMIAADGKVYRTRENCGATEVRLPAGEVIRSEVSFTQTVNGLVMFRGKDLPELVMPDLDTGFMPVDPAANAISGAGTENPTDGTQRIPNGESGEWMNNRLFIPFEAGGQKDLVAISDYLNATRYLPVRSQGRINQGSADRLVRLFKLSESQGLAFKGKSVYMVGGIQGDLTEMTCDELTKVYGLAGRRAVAPVGKDVWYLAPKIGIASVEVTVAGKWQGVDIPASATIQRVIDRIDWVNAGGATFDYWNNRFYAALPLDESKGYGAELERSGATYNLAILGGLGLTQILGVPGATYKWEKGTGEVEIDLGDGPVTESGEYVATSPAIYVQGPANGAVTGSLKRVYAGVNNAILVYDFLKQRWAGYDDGTAIMVKEFFKTEYRGQERLFFLSADGFINLMEELYFDEVAVESATIASNFLMAGYQTIAVTVGEIYALDGEQVTADLTVTNGSEVLTVGNGIVLNGRGGAGSFVAQGGTVVVEAAGATVGKRFILVKLSYGLDTEFVDFELLTRGYRCSGYGGEAATARKRWSVLRAELRTWYPRFTVSAVTEGMNEESTVAEDVTRDPVKYDKPFDKPDRDQTNVNDDHAQGFRQDYSVVLGETTTPSGSIVAGLLYYVEDLTGAASIVYNSTTVNAPGTFTGVAGMGTYTVSSGTPKVYGPGNYVFASGDGFEPDEHQEMAKVMRLPGTVRGRQCQVRLRNGQGRCCVNGLTLEARVIEKGRTGAIT